MKKLLSLVVLLALLAVAVVPAFAQTDMSDMTIAEIVVASAEGETPEFTTLLGAVGLADPAVLEALSNPEAQLTVFAPTDAAFAALAEALGEEAFAAALEDTEGLTSILLFHVIGAVATSEDVVALFGEEMEPSTQSVATLNGQSIDFVLDEEGNVTVNGATLVATDIVASNGVIHVIDAVILPESRTIAEIVVEAAEAEEAPEFTTLLTAVTAADPAVLEALSDPEAQLTVFAPTDAAFGALIEALGEEAFTAIVEDTPALTNILLYHVAEGVASSSVLAAFLAGEMEDQELIVLNEDGSATGTMLNGDTVTISVTEDGMLMINDAMVVLTDIDAANGVIHVIDAVLLPPTE